MSVSHRLAELELERFYAIAAEGRGEEIDAALARIPAAARMRDPIAIGLRAMRAVTGGDTASGVALLKRGVAHATGPAKQYLLELLVPLLINAHQIDEARDALLLADDTVPELRPAFEALHAVVAARTGSDADSARRAREALDAGRALDNPLLVGRVLQRTALAAFYRQDYDEAQDRALESARWHERIESYRAAAMSYSILYIIAHDMLADGDLARFHARRMTMNAHLAADRSLEHWGIVAQLDIAAESGDVRRVGSLRTRLAADPLNEQYYRERFASTVSEVLSRGWEGDFDAARVVLTALRGSETLSLPERALCDALLAVVALATWHTDLARRMARRVLSQTATRSEAEPLFDTRRRQVGRIVAAAVCIVLGDTVRGQRALSRVVDPNQVYAPIIGQHGIDEERAPHMMRGYVRFVNQAVAAAERMRPQHGLTSAELRVLKALPDGATLGAIAAELGKSRKTIERQVGSIYAKLHVTNRTQAIKRARVLGLADDSGDRKTVT